MSEAVRPVFSLLALRRYQAAILACALAAAAVPGLVLLKLKPGAESLFAVTGGLAAVLIIAWLIRPLSAVARLLIASLSSLPDAGDELEITSTAGGLLSLADRLADQMEGVRQKLGARHPITGLPGRDPFLAALTKDAPDLASGVVLGVVRLTDYDRLAAFDQAGADLALKAFAERMGQSLPKNRPLAQVDRDSFAVWFRDLGQEEAARALQALVYVLSQEISAGGVRLTPQLAVGASVFPSDSALPSELLTRAVAALDDAPRGKVAFFSAQSSAVAKEQFALEQELRGAVAREELMLQYQPLVDLERGEVVGAEALLRWRHPKLGLVSPGRFVPLLERSRLMGEVGLWVLNAACAELRSWREQGLGELKMAVNLSAVQCGDPRLAELVVRTLERHGLPPSSLELELTETAAMEDADHIRRLFTDLRALGVGVAIDDFGAGYSSLTYLKNLPISKLKIDREFVKDVTAARDSRAICSALLTLSRGLGIQVLAEGVETPEQVAVLRRLGCNQFQGYHFAPPLDGDVFARTVADPAWRTRLAEAPPPPARKVAG